MIVRDLAAPDFDPPAGRDTFRLDAGEVHVWALDLAVAPERLPELERLLAPDERARASRFRFARHRRRYMASWAAVRRLLGAYTAGEAESLAFTYGPKGKPELADDPDLRFNLSHSEELALVAVSRGGAVGIDIEHLRPLPDADEIAQRFFSRREVDCYLAQPAELRQRAFYSCWTRKEAFVKALGEGLFLSLDRFDVSLAPDQPARILAIDGSADEASGWGLTSIEPEEGFVGALATPWKPEAIRALSAPADLDRLSSSPD